MAEKRSREAIANEPTAKKFKSEELTTVELREHGFVDEQARGLEEFLGDRASWFSGVLKARFEDFLVSEVDPDGRVIALTSQEPFDFTRLNAEGGLIAPDLDSALDQIRQLVGEEQAQALKTFAEDTPEELKRSATLNLGVIAEKEKRTQVHQAVKKMEGLRTQTVDGAIVVEFGKKRNKIRRDDWPAHAPPYLHFVLSKSNMDTAKVLADMTLKLKCKSSRFTTAGTKDRRAVTTQRVSVFKVNPQRLLQITRPIRGVEVGNFSAEKDPIRMGDLYGNRFRIVLRNVQGQEPDVRASMEHVQAHGFINYFGMQRFGTGQVPSHHVGRAILQANWKEVVGLILSPTNRRDTKEALQHYADTKDIPKTLRMLRPYTIEHKVLSGLLKCGATAYYNAFCRLPRPMQSLYVHSYQSYIWNRVVSERIRVHGVQPVVGDYVLLTEQPLLHHEMDRKDDEESSGADEADVDSQMRQQVHRVTAEDIAEGKYSITDVVLPLPGSDVATDTIMAETYKKLMAEDNLEFSMEHKNKEFSLSGSYRKIIQKPLDLEWSLVHYDDETVPLYLSDIDQLRGKTLPSPPEDGKLLAIRLSMTLHRSTYATMCLREILKYPLHRQ